MPVRARIDLTDRSTIAVAPFMVVSDEGEETAARRGVDAHEQVATAALSLDREQFARSGVEMVNPAKPSG